MSRQIHFKKGDDFFERLPDEIFLQILSFIKGFSFSLQYNLKEGTTLGKLASVSKRWKGLVDNFDKLWKEIAIQELNLRESAFVNNSRYYFTNF